MWKKENPSEGLENNKGDKTAIHGEIQSQFQCTSVSRLEDENDEKLGDGISVGDCSPGVGGDA